MPPFPRASFYSAARYHNSKYNITYIKIIILKTEEFPTVLCRPSSLVEWKILIHSVNTIEAVNEVSG